MRKRLTKIQAVEEVLNAQVTFRLVQKGTVPREKLLELVEAAVMRLDSLYEFIGTCEVSCKKN